MKSYSLPWIQKSVVRKTINDRLLTYLDGVAITMPEKYDEICKMIYGHILMVNTKAKVRKTRNSNVEVEPVAE